MRLSWAVLMSHSIILIFLGISIGMEVFAFMNDLNWNAILGSKTPKEALPFEKFRTCRLYYSNGSVLTPHEGMYENVFKAKKRDLPYELPFLILICTSFLIYFVATSVYIGWKKILPNVYVCIATNFFGILSHSTSVGLILVSTIIYTKENLHYMGNEFCYAFDCYQCPDQHDYKERSRSMHAETRECLENLNICQITGFKDRVVYLVFGCFICSCVALASSVRRLGRHQRRGRIQPRKLDLDASNSKDSYSMSSDSVARRPSMENLNWKSSSGTKAARIHDHSMSAPI